MVKATCSCEVILGVSEGLLLEILDGEGSGVVVLLAIVLPTDVLSLLILCVDSYRMRGLFGRLSGLLHRWEQKIGCFELILAHALRQEGLWVVLTGKHVQFGLGQLKGTVLEHTHLVQSVAALVCKGICVPDAILFDLEQIEDLLEATLQQVDCSIIMKVFFFNLLGLLLSAIDIVHDLFELYSA